MDLYLMSEMPAFSTTVVILILMSIYGGGAAPWERDRVGTLPGQPAAGELPFSHFSGYVELPAAGTMMPARHIFYYFVQNDNSSQPAAEAPLVVRFGSGQFCSPIGNDGMLEVGPFRVQSDMTLVLNENSWHKEANLLFVDLPAGVGFSYSERITAEVISDEQVAKDAVDFLHRWAEKFPQHREAELYLGGEGHGAHHPVRLAAQSMRDKALLPPGMRLRGILLGDPEMDLESTFLGFVEYLSAKGMMSQASRQKVLTTCILNSTADCGMAMHLEAIALGVEVSAIIEPLCSPSTHPTSKFLWFDPCSVNYLHEYLNLPNVQTALHANHSHRVPGPWKICSKNLRQGQLPPGSDKPNWITDTMRELAETGEKLKIAIYHGDENARPPVTATRYGLGRVFNLTEPAVFGPWKDSNGEVGGYTSVYLGRKNNVTFSTVRGSGDYSGSYQPVRAMDLFRRFLRDP